MANPAEEILAILPNLIYFINSNGLDTVFKNTLKAVYTLLNAIEPIAKVDLYEVLGVRLDEMTFESLFDLALDPVYEATGYGLTGLDIDAVAELTTGKLVSYDSANGKAAYKMVYQSDAAEAEMVTVVLRLLVTFIMTEDNVEAVIGILKDNFSMRADAEKYVRALLKTIADCTVNTHLGMDKALATIYYVYYGVDIAVGETADGLKDINSKWIARLEELGMSENREEATVGNLIADILDIVFGDEDSKPGEGNDVLGSNGVAGNGALSFFDRIKAFFREIIDFFKELFSF